MAVPDAEGAAAETARIVTAADDGAIEGAVYSPAAEIVPQVIPEHPVPDTPQVTAVFVFPVTVAENCCCWPVPT